MSSKSVRIGTPLSASAVRVLLLGSGELGKEVALELQRFGVEVIAVDRYADAPAMQVAHRSHVLDMLDGEALRRVVALEQPHWIVPEVEAIATDVLLELEAEGITVIPSAKATHLTMNREGIRRLAAETCGLLTSPYAFAATKEEFCAAIEQVGMPCVIKPIMSSSGKGQSVVRHADDVDAAWQYAQEGGRAGQGKVIIEGFVDFDDEITLLTIRHRDGTSFCAPIGHVQVDGDYRESWQPQAMSADMLQAAQDVAAKITEALGGYGLFGVELFLKDGEVYFSEVSPRPHDTGMVTMISQDLSEFALHVRAILGLPIPNIQHYGASASCAVVVEGDSQSLSFGHIAEALAEPDTQLRFFGKPEVAGKRRMAVALARGATVDEARSKARTVAETLDVQL